MLCFFMMVRRSLVGWIVGTLVGLRWKEKVFEKEGLSRLRIKLDTFEMVNGYSLLFR